ncbi:MAG: peptidase C39, bacteriocin processing [Acidobacteriia bacterium]|nr:peptidase C39, bacteriocin processing [Terriglobia bacterium]
MNLKHQGRDSGRPYSLSRFALFAAPALIGAALLINAALPTAAQSQINGRVIGAPQVSAAQVSVSHPAQTQPSKLPQAPVQVAMPAPPPIEYLPGMEEALVATGPVDEGETKALRIALKEFHDAPLNAGPQADYADYAQPLLAFVRAHPKSNWNSALQLNLGLGYYHAGYWSRAFASFEKAWALGRNADSSPQARLMVDRAVGELAKMHARVGHDKELDALLREVVGKRPIGGPGTELIQGAREGLWAFRNNPGIAYLCGPRALKNVLTALKAPAKQIQVAEEARSGTHGFSLAQLAALADKAKLKYTLVQRKPGQPIPVPSVVNWSIHHYAAIVGKQGDLYQVMDPTFGDASGLLLTARAIDEGSSGYFLVPAKAMRAGTGWRAVSAKSDEAQAVYGMGTTSNSTLGASGVPNGCPVVAQQASANGASSPVPNRTPMTQQQEKQPLGGMTVSGCTPMIVGLSLGDTPIGYKPQKGVPSITGISYNSREAEQPATLAFGNVSPKWTHSWIGWVWDDPGVNREGWNVRRYASGGGGYDYQNSYNRTTGTWPAETTDNSQLWRTPVLGVATNYEHRLPDGSKENFTLSDGATTWPRKLFLTSVTDAQGNVTTLNYDGTFRLTSVVDAMGRSTTFTYGLAGFPLLVTQITDPFGRTTQLTYDTSQRLASITDPAGITSTFTYSATEPTFVNTLTTPYGTTNFSDTANSHDTPETNTRSLTIKDPLGFTDYTYFYQNPAITPSTDNTCIVPVGLSSNDDGLLQWRNTYHWDPHAFALGVTVDGSGNLLTEDFSKAYLTHWYHDQITNFTSTAVASVKPPLERRTWFNHPNQTTNYNSGILDRPTFVGRVLDDGTTQLTGATYNAFGLPLTYTDPMGRQTQYTYAANNQDLLTVKQRTALPSTFTTIATLGSYNALHEPQTYTDAAGKVWNFTWNAAGQPATVTDPNSGVTTRNYDASGRLSTIVNANSQTVLTLTYDAADRIATRTDSQGYVLTYAYDALDRITSITYPDGTADLYDYNFQSGPFVGTPSLELRKHTDRLGRATTYGFDADRRLTSVTEPTSGTATRTTSYHYYENGTLKEITDANGNVTHWDIDIESRPVAKTYGFGTSSAQTETYTYEASTSRLKAVTDTFNQMKSYAYALDDRPLSVSYIGAFGTPNVSFAWDGFFPRLTSMTDGLGTTNYSYTAIGTNGALKLASIDGPFANDVIGLTYDALGRIAGRNITGGNETFGYDAISRLTSHGTPLGSFTNTYLGQTDQTASRSVTNGAVTVSTNWGYDTNANDRRLISITNSGVTRSFTLGYGSGPVNPYDIMSVTDTAATGHPFATQTHAYGYDLIDRLLTATATTPGNNTYVYDPLDNATTLTDSTGTTNPTYNGLNQIATWGATNYTYDVKGNLLSDGTRSYKWDIENRLIEIDYVGSTAKSQFSYDGMGRRTVDVETASGGGTTTTRYLWCGSRICQVRDGTDTVQSRILPEGEYNAVSTQKAVYMPDQLGSVRDVLDATSGSLISSIDYSPYGAPVQTSGTFTPAYQYAGLFAHAPSGLLLSFTRAYDPVHPHWLNRDLLREWAGPNLYAYSLANPVNWVDVLGLTVKEYQRPINLNGPLSPLNWTGIDHRWIKTDKYEAGMGPTGGDVPGQGRADFPLAPVSTIDHTGQSKSPDATEVPIPFPVNEECVNALIAPGRPLGLFVPSSNDCHTFDARVLDLCRAKSYPNSR